MANNKVQLADGTVLIDLTDTTATAADVGAGKFFYTAGGIRTEGTATAGGDSDGHITQDTQGFIVLGTDGSYTYGALGSYTLSEMFYAIEHAHQSSGTVTVASYFSAGTESEFCDTGFSGNLRGILIFDEADPASGTTGAQALSNAYGFWSEATASGEDQAETSRGSGKSRNTQWQKLFSTSYMTSYRVNNGKLYITPKYANTGSTNFMPGHTYRWIAWPYETA